ncbi:serine/threonine-protein kinase Nek3 [Takifugu rubripes]|uniref:Protein kinase domain-containing protein n=1 Tax=Takifugu rubripes TaxID=31033 RepID=H2UHD1_TAKRU|nr:serine/threonine-protein kinase Nek3 [Takifugu rubripes]|eukprot:XP_011606950.1 PREDICTED: serine/threonine-protein kinase Nek3 [Takifugu rubripes]
MEKYSLDKVIGEGSFGRALLVRCKSTRDKYVVKEIQLPKNPSKLEGSRREAVLLSGMKHPNIVAFREAFEADGLLCIVMEYCSGGDLLQRILQQKTTQFCTGDILQWFAQMCAATQHIHEKRVLHRDLKSKNIFLTVNGTIKLGDFGSACILSSPRAYAHTYVGTPYYVAPEIWENKPYNNKSDVWSLGCVLYELCTLRHPFQAPSWKSLILKICRGAYPPLPGHLPYELQFLLKQMFKINPKDRPSVRTILTSHRVSRVLRAHLPPQPTEPEERERRAGRWNPDEATKVAKFLGEKSLMKDSFEGQGTTVMELSEARCESKEQRRKQWSEPSHSLLQKLANASIASSDSLGSHGSVQEEPVESRQRRRWVKDPPEELLRLLETAEVNRASSTFLIKRGGEDPLLGPLSQLKGDAVDSPEIDLGVDEQRLQPRSDDEDTDFEEESLCKWMDEAEEIFMERRRL